MVPTGSEMTGIRAGGELTQRFYVVEHESSGVAEFHFGCSLVAPRNDRGRSAGVADVLPRRVCAGQSVLACRIKINT
jgi:hypothetical protein